MNNSRHPSLYKADLYFSQQIDEMKLWAPGDEEEQEALLCFSRTRTHTKKAYVSFTLKPSGLLVTWIKSIKIEKSRVAEKNIWKYVKILPYSLQRHTPRIMVYEIKCLIHG